MRAELGIQLPSECRLSYSSHINRSVKPRRMPTSKTCTLASSSVLAQRVKQCHGVEPLAWSSVAVKRRQGVSSRESDAGRPLPGSSRWMAGPATRLPTTSVDDRDDEMQEPEIQSGCPCLALQTLDVLLKICL
jgi:hypothetical protein